MPPVRGLFEIKASQEKQEEKQRGTQADTSQQYRVGSINPIAIDFMQVAPTSRCKAARLSFRMYRHTVVQV